MCFKIHFDLSRSVSHAKLLIGDTIRRNASPVRLEGSLEGGALAGSRASLDSAGSDDAPRPREVRATLALLHKSILHF